MVLLVVDTQKGIVDERLYAFEKFVSNVKEQTYEHDGPVGPESKRIFSFFTCHYSRGYKVFSQAVEKRFLLYRIIA